MKHVTIKEQAICVTPFFVEGVNETTRTAFHDIDCTACLRQALAAAEARTRLLRELLDKVEGAAPRCRVYDTACMNPIYCDQRDACCAGDPECRKEIL
jgi:hypothetical protein